MASKKKKERRFKKWMLILGILLIIPIVVSLVIGFTGLTYAWGAKQIVNDQEIHASLLSNGDLRITETWEIRMKDRDRDYSNFYKYLDKKGFSSITDLSVYDEDTGIEYTFVEDVNPNYDNPGENTCYIYENGSSYEIGWYFPPLREGVRTITFSYTMTGIGAQWGDTAELYVGLVGKNGGFPIRYLHGELPKAWKSFQSYKGGTIIAFLDSLMNNVLYRDAYDCLSLHVETGLNAEVALQSYAPEELLDCDAFLCVDQILVRWLTERLLSGDIGAKLDQLSIPDICEKRMKMHFGRRTENEYRVIRSAYVLATAANYQCPDDFEKIIGQYQEKDWMIDQEYRRFYTAFDAMENGDGFEALKNMVENIYTNRVLAVQLPKWNAALHEEDAFLTLPLQRNFYNRYIKNSKERTVVIISDAMRYEVGRQLFLQMQDDPKCTASMETMLGILPSYTRLGMAALLPHNTLSMKDDYTVLVDEKNCDNLTERQTILQMYQPDALCLQFDDIKNRKIAELREIFTGRQLLYVYHNQIDARGDKANTEDEVFVACEEALREIKEFIHRISTSANTYHFIVTSDHGFLYKRDKITESEKISGVSGKKAFVNRRFIVADSAVTGDGIDCLSLGKILGNEDAKMVSFPVSSHVFKVSGGGQNYVHGGSSPQEMLIPVLDVKMERGHMETRPVQIALVSMVQKITNLITTMDFIQSDPVSDIMKEATYRIYFLSEENEKISNENILVADSRESDPLKRISRLRFTFKNKKYDKEKKYFLVVYDETTGLEVFRHPVTMDLAFADDYGFGF